eukprot:m.158502 g.158502  ORF g.158502 m.158502 type:complete len:315 (-) comp9825_c0_seq9:3141-4085(-)
MGPRQGKAYEGHLRRGEAAGGCGALQQAGKDAIARRKGRRRVELDDAACVEHHDPVAVHDRVEPVRDGQNRAVSEAGLDGLLDQLVCRVVYVGRRLVKHQHMVCAKDGARETEELALPHAEIAAALADLRVQPALHGLDDLFELCGLQRAPDCKVVVRRPWVQVAPNRAAEEHGILRNHADRTAQALQRQRARLDAIEDDRALGRAHAEQRGQDRALARTGPPDDADLLSGLDGAVEAAQHVIGVDVILELQVAEHEVALGWPRRIDHSKLLGGFLFGRQCHILRNTLDRCHHVFDLNGLPHTPLEHRCQRQHI